MPIKIVITDDHPLVVSGLRTILKSCERIEVIATYNNGDDLMAGLRKELPDVLLTDLKMPGKLQDMELVYALRELYPDLPVLILSGQEASFKIREVMAQGIKGYLLKNTTDQDMLVHAIEQVHYGEIFLEPSLKTLLLKEVLQQQNESKKAARIITQRQVEIIKLIAKGYTNQQIADQLFLSIRTIESHRLRIMQKMDVSNVTTLLKKASDLGLINLSGYGD